MVDNKLIKRLLPPNYKWQARYALYMGILCDCIAIR